MEVHDTGMWIGSIMLFNVWVLIWPNQQKILGLVPASDEQKAKARKVALLASRTNFALSIPLVLCMGSATHACRFKVRSCGARPHDSLRKCCNFHPTSLSRSQLP